MTGATKNTELQVMCLFLHLWPVSGCASDVKYSIFEFIYLLAPSINSEKNPWCQDGSMEQRKRPSATSARQMFLSISHSFFYLYVSLYIYIYVYVYYIHINIQRGRPGIPFYPTLCGRVEWAGGSCGRVRPARRPISRLYLTPTRRHTHTDDKPCPKQ